MKKAIVVLAVLAMASAANANVLVNGDFSAGDVAPFNVGSGGEAIGTIPGWNVTGFGPGTNHPSVQGGVYEDATGVTTAYLWQSAYVGAGATPTIDGWISYGGEDRQYLEIFVVDGQYATGASLPGGLGANNPGIPWAFKTASWGGPPNNYSGTFDQLVAQGQGIATDNRGSIAAMPSGYATIVFRYGWGGDDTGTLQLDNLVMTPEPTALAFVALGFLPLLRRRRAK